MAHGCTYCTEDLHCQKFTDEKHTSWCYGEGYPCKDRRYTNADRIRAMTDEELATFFGTLPCCPPGNADELCFPDNTCGADTKMMVKCWGTWLKATAEEAQDGT